MTAPELVTEEAWRAAANAWAECLGSDRMSLRAALAAAAPFIAAEAARRQAERMAELEAENAALRHAAELSQAAIDRQMAEADPEMARQASNPLRDKCKKAILFGGHCLLPFGHDGDHIDSTSEPQRPQVINLGEALKRSMKP